MFINNIQNMQGLVDKYVSAIDQQVLPGTAVQPPARSA